VEPGEAPEQAALREAWEETGVEGLSIQKFLGSQDELRPEGLWVVGEQTRVYARPDPDSFDWAELRRGLQVRQLRQENGYIQVTFEEWDRIPDPAYLTYQITGWVPEAVLCRCTRRHFYHLTSLQAASLPERWERRSDQHLFQPFWAPITHLPPIIPPQDAWLAFAPFALLD
jgi:8-oxo-dGTP pyrophosphatase MutT (NUDIX family)